MSTIRRTGRVAAGLLATGVTVGVPALAAAATSTDDEGVIVTVVDEGDPIHRVVLVPPMTPGTMADSTTTFDIDMAMVGSGYPIDIDLVTAGEMSRSSQVIDVAADGSFTTRETLTSFDMTNTTPDGAPADPDELGLEGGTTTDLSPLVDVPLVAEYSADGDLADVASESAEAMTPEQAELIDELADGGFGTEGFGGLLPTAPVGEGAVWTVTEADSPGGLDIGVPVELRFTLVSLKDTDYHIEFAFDGDMADYLEAEDGTEVDGEMTLTGTISGDASRSFDQRWTMDMSMDMTFTEDDIAIDVDATIRYEHNSTTR
jgi:hypothetical protein